MVKEQQEQDGGRGGERERSVACGGGVSGNAFVVQQFLARGVVCVWAVLTMI